MKKSITSNLGTLVYGVHPILELIKAKKRKLLALYTTNPSPKAFTQIAQLVSNKSITVHKVTKDALTRMAGTTEHQSIVALASPFVIRSKPFTPTTHPFILMLDGIQDVRNAGAILRSAYCVGVNGIIITRYRGTEITPAVLKASAGLAEHLDIMYVPSAMEGIKLLKNNGYHIYLATLNGVNAATYTYTFPLCLIIGNEAEGISPTILSQGTAVTLPQRSPDISYNASVAAGILLFVISSLKK